MYSVKHLRTPFFPDTANLSAEETMINEMYLKIDLELEQDYNLEQLSLVRAHIHERDSLEANFPNLQRIYETAYNTRREKLDPGDWDKEDIFFRDYMKTREDTHRTYMDSLEQKVKDLRAQMCDQFKIDHFERMQVRKEKQIEGKQLLEIERQNSGQVTIDRQDNDLALGGQYVESEKDGNLETLEKTEQTRLDIGKDQRVDERYWEQEEIDRQDRIVKEDRDRLEQTELEQAKMDWKENMREVHYDLLMALWDKEKWTQRIENYRWSYHLVMISLKAVTRRKRQEMDIKEQNRDRYRTLFKQNRDRDISEILVTMETETNEQNRDMTLPPAIDLDISMLWPDVQAEVVPSLETQFNTNIETKCEPNLEPKVEVRVETKFETETEPNNETKNETKLETQMKLRSETEVKEETQVELIVETRDEVAVDANVESTIEMKVDTRVETKLETILETTLELKDETTFEANAENKVESETETEVEMNVETEIGTCVGTESETKVEKEVEKEIEMELEVEGKVDKKVELEQKVELKMERKVKKNVPKKGKKKVSKTVPNMVPKSVSKKSTRLKKKVSTKVPTLNKRKVQKKVKTKVQKHTKTRVRLKGQKKVQKKVKNIGRKKDRHKGLKKFKWKFPNVSMTFEQGEPEHCRGISYPFDPGGDLLLLLSL